MPIVSLTSHGKDKTLRVQIEVRDSTLDLIVEGVDPERRRLPGDTLSRFADWAAQYEALCGRQDAAGRLLALGRELYAWLDGGDRWLTRLLDATIPPLVMEFQALSTAPDDLQRTFLQVPWELLAHDMGYLAGDAALLFCPVRRLGRVSTPPPLDSHCLGLMFMAAAPRGANELDYGAEENAILNAAGDMLNLELVVEESGNAELLAARMAEVGAMQVLHLSCHGQSEPQPILLLEDEEGNPQPTGPEELIPVLRTSLPRLMFVSACETATAGAVAAPLALTLVRAGVPSVLGWDGSVYDHEATAFARELYKRLALRRSVEEAVSEARRELLHSVSGQISRDWHLARLWLGPQGGGALVGGNQRRRMLGPDHGHKAFLDARRQQSQVASREGFVGRRRDLQTSFRWLRGNQYAGLLIHGLGRLGKSSLAARIANRRPDLEPVVIFGVYDALGVAEAIVDAVPETAAIIEARLNDLRDHPERLGEVLRQVLEGPCQQAGSGKPMLLVIDDLEQILDAPATSGERWQVKASHVTMLRAVLRTFARARTASRLILTSRYTFTLEDGREDLAHRLAALQLPPMDEASARRQALRREQMRTSGTAVPRDRSEDEATRHRQLIQRCVAVAKGNPGLQDLLFDLVLADWDTAQTALTEMEAYLASGHLPEQAEVHAFLENLAIQTLLDLAGGDARELLRRATLFEVPVLREIVTSLTENGATDVERLLGLGLCDRFEDLVEPTCVAVAVNDLVRPKAGRLRDSEAKSLVRNILDKLFTAWGGTEGNRRPYQADAELTRLGLLVDHVGVIEATAANALTWLDRQHEYRQAAAWAQQAMALLDQVGIEPAINLLRRAGEACIPVGEVEAARRFYSRALEQVDVASSMGNHIDAFEHHALVLAQARLLVNSGEPDAALSLFEAAWRWAEQQGNELNAAIVLGDIARLRANKGEVEEALRLHEERIAVYERLGEVRARAVTLGDIARLRANKGEVEEALRLHEEELAVYERLGEVRARAVTLGDIARLRANKGEVEEALRLHEERLETNRQLGDLDGQAAALWDIAQLELSRNDVAKAAPMIVEAYQLCDHIGRLEGICVIGTTLGQLLIADGQREQGLAVLQRSEQGYRQMQRSEQGYRQMQRHRDADQVAALIDQLQAE